jgi:hypothetical protein
MLPAGEPDANDTVTLDFVNKTSLTASNFHFV